MNVNMFKHCPYCGGKLSSNSCEMCRSAFYSSPHPNVCILIFDQATQQILLVKEPKPHSVKELNWEMPGGFVDLVLSEGNAIGESLEVALERELEEELGNQNARALMEHVSYLTSRGDTYREGTPIVCVYFLAAIRKAELTVSTNLSVEMRWSDVGDLPSFEYSSDGDAIEYFKQRL